MRASDPFQEHLGYLLLNDEKEINYVEPVLLKQVSAELNEWIGLGFEQWLNYAFKCVTCSEDWKSEELKISTWTAGKTESCQEYQFRHVTEHSPNLIHVFRLRKETSKNTQAKQDCLPSVKSDRLVNHWNDLLVWMGPGFLHDANNQMAALVSLAECLLSNPDMQTLSVEDQEDLEWILKCGKEAGDIFQLLTKVYKLKDEAYNYIDTRELLEESAKLIEIALPKSLKIELSKHPTELPAWINRKTFYQIIIGLIAQLFPNRNACPSGALQFRLFQTRSTDKTSKCIAGKRIETDGICIEMKIACKDGSSTYYYLDVLNEEPNPVYNLVEQNKFQLHINSAESKIVIQIPLADLDCHTSSKD